MTLDLDYSEGTWMDIFFIHLQALKSFADKAQ